MVLFWKRLVIILTSMLGCFVAAASERGSKHADLVTSTSLTWFPNAQHLRIKCSELPRMPDYFGAPTSPVNLTLSTGTVARPLRSFSALTFAAHQIHRCCSHHSVLVLLSLLAKSDS